MTTVRNPVSVMADLPERLRYVLHLRIVRGLSVDRAAQLLGSDRGHVLLLQHEALNALRRLLRDADAVDQGEERAASVPPV